MKVVSCKPEFPEFKCYYSLVSDSIREDDDIPTAEILTQLKSPLCLFFRADRIASWTHIQAAILNSLNAVKTNSAKMKSFRAEVLGRLGFTWGVKDLQAFFRPVETVPCVAVVLARDIEEDESVRALIRQSEGDVDDLTNFTDVPTLRAHYQIKNDAELELPGGLKAAIMTRIAAKGI